ncbi:MAG: oligosaccharide flippase family protein [Candidatus Omnitrophica bacterium]|nr:oligosaccharide flippase family protein [Candidatus Omnitrophota bacterium]
MKEQDFKKNVVRGTVILFLVKLILLPISIILSIILARLLEPVHFGIYGILSLFIETSRQISEWGLVAFLIQKYESPDIREYRTVFTLRLIISIFFLILIWLLLPFLEKVFKLPSESILMAKVFSSVLIIGTLSAVSSAILYRRLQFKRIGLLYIISVLGYQIPAVVLAFLGFRAWSFIWASVISVSIYTISCFIFSPWKIGFFLYRPVIKRILEFGSFFQLTHIVALIRDNIIPILGGIFFGPQAVGYLSWAYSSVLRLSALFHQSVGSIAFPAFSRIQNNLEAVSRFFSKSIRYLMLFTAPIMFILFALSYEVILIIFKPKWIPAIPALILFGFLSLLGHFTTIGDNLLKGIGKVKKNFLIMSIWTILSWAVSLSTLKPLGYNSIALGWTLSALVPAIWITIIVGRNYPLDLRGILNPILASAISAFLVFLLKSLIEINIYTLFLLGGFGLCLYLIILWILEGKRLLRELLELSSLLRFK